SGVPVVAQPEQSEIVSINLFATLGRQKIEIVLILLGRDMGIDLTAHSHDRFFRNACRNEKGFTRHSKIALRVIWRNTALVAERDQNSFPRQVTPDPRDLGIDWPRRVSAR